MKLLISSCGFTRLFGEGCDEKKARFSFGQLRQLTETFGLSFSDAKMQIQTERVSFSGSFGTVP